MMDAEMFLVPGIRLGDPSAWFWTLIALAVGLSYFFRGTLSKGLYQLIHPENRSRLVREDSPRQRTARNVCLILVLFFSSLALLQPKWGFQWEEVRRRGVDLILAVDVSKSMLAQDLPPNRLVRAKRKILDLLSLVEGDRIGLIAFAGTSYLQCPLTLDYGAFRMFLDLLDTDLIPQQGTAIDQAISMAIDAFEGSGVKSRALVLITDGEEHSGAYLKAAKEAAAQGIRIYTLGIGSPEGHPVPDPGKQGHNLKDRSGNIVISRLNETILQEISLETGGVYVRATTSDDDLERIYVREILEKLELQDLKTTRQKRFEPRFQLFLLAAVFFLCLGSFLGRYQLPMFAKTALIALFFLFGSPGLIQAKGYLEYFGLSSEVQQILDSASSAYEEGRHEEAVSGFSQAEISLPGDPANSLNLGNSYYKNGDYSRAREYFEKALASSGEGSGSQSGDKHRKIESKARYNLGNTAYRLGQLEDAIKQYEQVLAKDQDHTKARKNLEFVQKKLKEHQEKQKGQNQQGSQNQDGSQNKKDSSQQEDSKQKQSQSKDQNNNSDPNKGKQNNQSSQATQDQTNPSTLKQDPQESKDPSENKEDQEKSQSSTQNQTSSGDSAEQKKSSGEQGEIQRLSPEEAQRFLNRLSSENAEQMKRYIQYRLKGKGRSGRKEW
jgi:Ca-activated chloride channel homolog